MVAQSRKLVFVYALRISLEDYSIAWPMKSQLMWLISSGCISLSLLSFSLIILSCVLKFGVVVFTPPSNICFCAWWRWWVCGVLAVTAFVCGGGIYVHLFVYAEGLGNFVHVVDFVKLVCFDMVLIDDEQ